MSKTVLFCEFWNVSPHLDGGLELAIKYALSGYTVKYLHLGSLLPFCECYIQSDSTETSRESLALHSVNKFLKQSGSSIIEQLDFDPRVNIEYVSIEDFKSNFSYDDMAELTRFTHNNNPVGSYLASCLSDVLNSAYLSPVDNISLLHRMYSSYLFTESYLDFLFQSLVVDLVFVFNGRYPYTRAVVDVCHRSSIPIKYHERGCETASLLVRPHSPHEFDGIKSDIQFFWNKAVDLHGTDYAISLGTHWYQKRSSSGSAIIGDRSSGLQ